MTSFIPNFVVGAQFIDDDGNVEYYPDPSDLANWYWSSGTTGEILDIETVVCKDLVDSWKHISDAEKEQMKD